MKKTVIFVVLLTFYIARSQVGVNTVTPQAMLDIPASNVANPSNQDGVLIPRVAAFPLINPTASQHAMMVFLTTASGGNAPGFYYWDNPTTSWKGIVGSITGGWGLTGNPGTNPNINFLGTTNLVGLTLRTNNTNRFSIDEIGNGRFGMNGFADSLSNRSKFEIGAENTDFNDMTLRYVGADHPVFNILHDGGTKFTAPSRLGANVPIGEIKFFTYESGSPDFSSHIDAARIGAKVENASGDILAGMYFRTTSSSTLPSLYINGAGNVGIGNETPLTLLHVAGKLTVQDGSQATGRILRSDASGTATWVNPTSILGGSLDSAYDFPTAGAGRMIFADAGALTVNGTDGIVSTGTFGSGAAAPTGAAVKFLWYPKKAAFRAGEVDFSQWNDNNIGAHSVAFGSNNVASGIASSAFGSENNALSTNSAAFGSSNVAGENAFVSGSLNTASGIASVVFGMNNLAGGNNTTLFGFQNSAPGTRSFVSGSNNIAPSFGETVIGIGATTYAPSVNAPTQFRAANATDRLFTIGNAIDANNNNIVDSVEKRDAMVVLKNGNIGLGSSTPADKLHVVGNIRMIDGNQAAGKVMTSNANGTASWQPLPNSGGTLDAGYDFGGAGLGNTIVADAGAVTIAGSDGLVCSGTLDTGALAPTGSGVRMFWNPRKGAFRAGRVTTGEWNDVNIGKYSFAVTENSTASGTSSAAIGSRSRASGNYAIALGYFAQADGESSIVAGRSSSASGEGAISLGYFNVSVGPYSHTLGSFNISTGHSSLAIGDHAFTSGLQSIAMGNQVSAYGEKSAAFGLENNAQSLGETVMGIGATNYSPVSEPNMVLNPNNRLFVIGNAQTISTSGIIDSDRSNALTILKNGRTALGNITPGGQFQLSLDQGRKPGTNTWTIASDERLKYISGNYEKGLSEITQLQPILYHYKNVGTKTFEPLVLQTEYAGFSAQKVKNVFPEAVGLDDDGYLNLNIHSILVASVNAFKELKLQNDTLSQQNRILSESVKNQQKVLDEVMRRLEKLETQHSSK